MMTQIFLRFVTLYSYSIPVFLLLNMDGHTVNICTHSTQVDFGKKQAAVAHMNAFFADRTNGTVNHLVNSGVLRATFRQSSVQMLLLSALSARLAWAVPADKTHDARRPFYLDIDLPVKVDYVTVTNSFRYGRVDNVTVMEIPLDGGKQSISIIMPDDIRGLRSLEDRLDTKMFLRMDESMASRTLDVHLPRFRIAQNFGLREVINELGVTRMFARGSAELGGVSNNEGLYVGQLVHESVLALNRPEAYTPPDDDVISYDINVDVHTVKIDRPFFYVIREKESGLALFLGRISHPTTEIGFRLGASRSSASSLARFSAGLVLLLLLLWLHTDF